MMNSRNLTVGILGAALVALVVALFVLNQKMDEQAVLIGRLQLQQRSASEAGTVTPTAPARSAPPAAAPGNVPWQWGAKPSETPSPLAPAPATTGERNAKVAQITELQQDLKALMAKSAGRPAEIDIGAVDALLVRLIEIQGNPVVGGVDLRVLRQNLVVAKDMQALAKELESETKKPKPDRAKIDSLVQRIQSLQQGLRLGIAENVANPAPQAPLQAPRPVPKSAPSSGGAEKRPK
ncbi:MAG: hypothetical protein LBL72_00805 [Candidatus Accumulibacter sp.]|jgi:hypothetical protein|nr:hypothetical protein [Accumulibacter sp.]